MKKKRILHVTPALRGGVHTVIQEILSGTLDSYENTVVVTGKYVPLDPTIEKNIKFIGLNKGNRFSIKKIIRVGKLIKKNDIIHVHLFPALYYCALFKAFFPKKKFIYTEHASTNNRRKYKIFKFFEIPIYRSYNYIVAVSESCKKNLDEWLCHKVNIQTIYNGINIKRFQSQPKFDFQQIGINSQYIITMVARLSADKDFSTLLKAITLLDNNYHLVLVGEGNQRKQIEDEIHRLSLEQKVTMLGYRNDIASILASSTLSVLSSHGEGMGLTIIESLAVNTPCLGSDVEGIQDILPKEYRFSKGKYKELANLIEKVTANKIPPLPYHEIVEKYSTQNMVKAYCQIYRESILGRENTVL